MNLNARDIMNRQVRTVSPALRLVELDRLFVDSPDISAFPVVQGGEVVGIVTRFDVVRALALEHNLAESYLEGLEAAGRADEARFRAIADLVGVGVESLSVGDIMSSRVVTLTPSTRLEQVARTMLERSIGHVVILEDGAIVGLVSSMDFVLHFVGGSQDDGPFQEARLRGPRRPPGKAAARHEAIFALC